MNCEVCGLEMLEVEWSYKDGDPRSFYKCELCGGCPETLYKKVYDTLEYFILSEWEEITIEDFELYAGKFNNLEEYIEQAREDLGYVKEIRRGKVEI